MGYEITSNLPYLKCIKEIPACPELAVGDLLWKQAHEIQPGGYEYAVCVRREDGVIIKFRVEHLDDCFELEAVEEMRHVD